METKNLPILRIHQLSKAQYERELEANRIEENAIYLMPDEEQDLDGYATEEYVDTAIQNAQLGDNGALEAHTSDSNIHVTNAEKQQWNAKSNFSGDYNDLTNAPDIAEDGSGDLVIADANGNVIFRSNGSGFETVNLAVQNLTINGMTIQEMIKAYVDAAILEGES